jgi:surface polysaccharide O-acyltransferase-like enzyme
MAVPVLNKIKRWPYLWIVAVVGLFWSPTAYVGFFILGYLLNQSINNQKFRYLTLFTYLVTSLTTAFLTFQWVQKIGYFDEKFYHYYSPLVVVAGVSLFLFIKDRSLDIGGIWAKLSKHSFSIYLSHLLILERSYFMGVPLQYVTTVVGSLAISMLADKLIGWIQTKLIH